ncbi:MAG: MerR family transcriptional regulator [Candidatus Aminicenantes bacterium]|nr:MerR family transcriptional regulator [Candidatus Aminicenantes bacterium]
MKTPKPREKLVYRLEEVCRLVQLAPEVINRWEEEFPFLNAGLTAKGHKIFRRQDVEIIKRLKELLFKERLTLAGARRKIEEEFGLKEKSQVHPDKMKKILVQIRESLEEIKESLEKSSRKR